MGAEDPGLTSESVVWQAGTLLRLHSYGNLSWPSFKVIGVVPWEVTCGVSAEPHRNVMALTSVLPVLVRRDQWLMVRGFLS